MAKQLTAPGCKYSIVARVDTTIYSPDQKWTLDVPAGQSDFIAETNEIIIPADAMLCPKKYQIDEDIARVNVLGKGAGSMATFVTRAIEQIVGKGNAKVEYGDGKLAVSLASSVTSAQITEVERLLQRLLPKDVTEEIDPLPSDYMRAEFLEANSTGTSQHIVLEFDMSLSTDRLDIETENQRVRYAINTDHCIEGTYIAPGTGVTVAWGTVLRNGVPVATFNYGHVLYGDTWVTVPTADVFDFNVYKMQVSGGTLKGWLNGTLAAEIKKGSVTKHLTALSLFATTGTTGYVRRYPVRKKYYKQSINGKVCFDMIPVLDETGTPCLFNLVNRQPFYNQGTGQFIAGLTMAQALNLAHLPAPTTINTLTVSLPKEASLVQYNQEVEAALSIAAEKGWNIAVQYRDEFENEAIRDKYAACKTVAEVKAVNPDYLNDLTSDGDWIYPLDSLTASRGFSNAMKTWRVNKIKTRFLQLKRLETWTFSYATAKSIEVYCSETTIYVDQFAGDNGKLQYMKLHAPKTKTINQLIWGNGLVDLDFEAPNLENCPMFGGYGGYITHTSAIKFMNSLPPWSSGTHNLKAFTVHIDGETDPEFQEALTSLENRGWDVDVQWNGTPTNTASTFNMGTLIYAKVGEHELPDGTTEQILDWGHYVTNWEERGYEQFRSLESAYEYFGLEQETEA